MSFDIKNFNVSKKTGENSFITDLQKILTINQKVFLPLKNMWTESKQGTEPHPILDAFLKEVGLPQNKETRYIAYERIFMLKSVNLDNYLDNYIHQIKKNFSHLKIKTPYENLSKQDFLNKAYKFVVNLYLDYFRKVVKEIKKEELLDDFYVSLLEGSLDLIGAFNDFYLSWSNYIYKQNEILERKFGKDSEKIMAFLRDKNLLERDENGKLTDRSYTVLKGGKMVSYFDAFPAEISQIVNIIEDMIQELSQKDLDSEKRIIIEYLNSIKEAYLEKDTTKLLSRWQKVDELWMKIKGPIQIVHSMEYYDDAYRKAVQPEFDIRILDVQSLQSEIKEDIKNMFESLFSDFDKQKYADIYDFSKNSLNSTMLFVSQPIIFGGGYMNGHFSAQVVPNDESVSKKYGKKIFAFPSRVLTLEKQSKDKKHRLLTIDRDVFESFDAILNDEELYYKIYDVLTIGHEFGHTLWMGDETEIKMNLKTGNFKNIEEWKATTGGLVSYFLKTGIDAPAEDFDKKIMLMHFKRSLVLLERYKIEELLPYYNETLIHLDLLYKSGILRINNKKAYFNLSDENFKKVKQLYLDAYKTLVNLYLNKEDAGKFLFKYVVKEKGVNLPRNVKLREFVTYYQKVFEES